MNVLLSAHVPLIVAAYACLAGASILGIIFLAQDRLLKTRQPLSAGHSLPSLERLDLWVYRLIGFAFPLLTVAMLLGALRAHEMWGRYWDWSPKETFALITWTVYLAFLALRQTWGWRGRKSTYLSLAGFGLAVLTFSAVYWVRFY